MAKWKIYIPSVLRLVWEGDKKNICSYSKCSSLNSQQEYDTSFYIWLPLSEIELVIKRDLNSARVNTFWSGWNSSRNIHRRRGLHLENRNFVNVNHLNFLKNSYKKIIPSSRRRYTREAVGAAALPKEKKLKLKKLQKWQGQKNAHYRLTSYQGS